jgi:hypothetical protein
MSRERGDGFYYVLVGFECLKNRKVCFQSVECMRTQKESRNGIWKHRQSQAGTTRERSWYSNAAEHV